MYFYVEGPASSCQGPVYGVWRMAPLRFKSPAWQPGRPKLRSPDREHFCLDPVCTHGCSRRSFSSIKSPPSASFPLEPVATAVRTTIVHIGQRHSGKLSRTSPCLRAQQDNLYMRCSISLSHSSCALCLSAGFPLSAFRSLYNTCDKTSHGTILRVHFPRRRSHLCLDAKIDQP